MIECSACGARAVDEARFCASCGARLSLEVENRTREQRKTVTAVFTDIVGSTTLASRLGSVRLR
jgi:class 3 adenylate cyclase